MSAPGILLEDGPLNQVRHHAVLGHGLAVQAIRAMGRAGTKVGPAENMGHALMFLRLSRHYFFHHIPEPLVHYYVSGDTMTNTLGEAKAIEALEIILEKHWPAFEKNPRLLAKRAFWIGSFHMRSGDKRKGRRYLNLALRHHRKPRHLAAVTVALFGQPAYRAFHRIASRPNHLALEGS